MLLISWGQRISQDPFELVYTTSTCKKKFSLFVVPENVYATGLFDFFCFNRWCRSAHVTCVRYPLTKSDLSPVVRANETRIPPFAVRFLVLPLGLFFFPAGGARRHMLCNLPERTYLTFFRLPLLPLLFVCLCQSRDRSNRWARR